MKKRLNKAFKRVLTASVSAFILSAALPLGIAAETFSEDYDYIGGVIPEPDEVFEAHLCDEDGSEEDLPERGSFPPSVDLSTSKYFPPIGDQGGVGSCAVFSTVYYQFTYEANKLNDIASTAENAYSPQWPYYYLRSQLSNGGVAVTSVYGFLEDHGALHMEDNPYSQVYDPEHTLYSDTSKMRQALNTRLADYTTIKISSSVTMPQDQDLDMVKNYLNNGKLLNVSSYFNFNIARSRDDLIMYRCCTHSSGHAFVIVGYDDNKSFDVNGNGIIEKAEKGAFKIANSWGSNFGNDGYAWVLYDALNTESAIPGNWEENLSGTRVRAFAFENDYNWFRAITVCNYRVDYVAELTFDNVSRKEVRPALIKQKDGVTVHGPVIAGPCTTKEDSFTMVFDCYKVCQGVEYENNGFSLGIDFYGNVKNPVSAKITDNRGNTIKDMTPVENQAGSYRTAINLTRGDVDYKDGITNKDAVMISRFCSGWDNLSNVQRYLADYNGDGQVNNADAMLIKRYLATH